MIKTLLMKTNQWTKKESIKIDPRTYGQYIINIPSQIKGLLIHGVGTSASPSEKKWVSA